MKKTLTLLQQNWKAGLTVALVSLPLSVSLAVAANATPLMGVITAIWAGLIGSIFGGSHYNIIGPTGALSGILASYAILHGMEILPTLAILTGMIILLFYVFHIEKYLIFIPSSVIHGFTLGVAFIIALNQLNFALGLKNLTPHERFIENIRESLQHLGQADPATVGIFLGSLALLFVFLKKVPKIPGPIVLAPIGILVGYLSSQSILPFNLQTLYTKFGEIPSAAYDFHNFSMWMKLDLSLFSAALAVAIIAVLETLISGKIADGMTKTKFKARQEVLGLGLANVASGIFGGIPATAALARTSLNVKTGATHKTSATISSVIVGLISVLFLSTFRFLPLAIVGAILVYVAVRMVEAEHFKHLYAHDKKAFGVSLLVAVITLAEDPIIGILIGATISLLIFVNQLSKGQSEITYNKNKSVIRRLYGNKENYPDEEVLGDVIVYRFAGQMTYINAQSHLENIRKINGGSHTVILGLRNLFYMDMDGLDALEEIVETLQSKGKKVFITGAGGFILPVLNKAHWFLTFKKKRKVHDSTSHVLGKLGFKMEK